MHGSDDVSCYESDSGGMGRSFTTGRRCTQTRVLILCNICVYLEGLARCFDDERSVTVVGTASTVDDSLRRIVEVHPDVVFIDMAMSRSDSVLRRLRSRHEDSKILALTATEDNEVALGYIEAGASGCIGSQHRFQDLVRAIHAVRMGTLLCSFPVVAQKARREEVSADAESLNELLSRRELQVLRLLHKRNKQIADELDIAVSTAKNHVQSILRKLKAHSRAEALILCRKDRVDELRMPGSL